MVKRNSNILHSFHIMKKCDIPMRGDIFEMLSPVAIVDAGCYEYVFLDDAFILNDNNWKYFFKGFSASKTYMEQEGEGIDYYGITYIPNEQLQGFIDNMRMCIDLLPVRKRKKRCSRRKEMKERKRRVQVPKQIKALIYLCEKALNNGDAIIHIGI